MIICDATVFECVRDFSTFKAVGDNQLDQIQAYNKHEKFQVKKRHCTTFCYVVCCCKYWKPKV